MQKHEVESATLLFGVGLPLAGWLAGTYIGNVPLSPFPGFGEQWNREVS
ncbi:hypothetical protein ACSAMZ_21870 (plasmid) [Xanthomonas citri pv. bilvae]